jgi:O-antigen/teichoic acid export membrane protein
MARQYGVLTLANYATIAVSLLTTILLTTQISESDYGSYRYVINIATMLVSFSNLGVYYSTARLLTSADEVRARRLYGATIMILLGVVAIVSLVVLAAYPLVAGVVDHLDRSFLIALPIFLVLTLQRMFVSMLKGSNRITEVAVQTALPSVLALALYGVLWVFGEPLTLALALAIYFVSYLVTHAFTMRALRVTFDRKTKEESSNIIHEQKRTGFELYKGSLLSVFSADAIAVLAGSLTTRASYGSYALALNVASPIMQIPATIGVVRFRDSASRARISRRELLAVGALGASSLLVLNVLIRVVFGVLYKGGYAEAPGFAAVLSVGFLLHGFGDYVNNFLSSHGEGARIKRSAYASGITQIALAVAMVPFWGIWGLVVSRAAASATYCAAMWYGYRGFRESSVNDGR